MFLSDPNRAHPVIRAVRAGVSLLLCLQFSSVLTLTLEARSFVGGAAPSSGGSSGGADASAAGASTANATPRAATPIAAPVAHALRAGAPRHAAGAGRSAHPRVAGTVNGAQRSRRGRPASGGGGDLDPALWQGAALPVQSSGQNGRLVVKIDQKTQKAILTWDSFNVGRETDMVFDQQGNKDWVALNRVTDAQASPTQILGTIKADGSVYVLNRNGVIFGGASQVNVGNLVAAAAGMTNAQFLDRGLYGASPTSPTFTDALGAVTVEAGAQITTHAPTTATEGGGAVLLLGSAVTNAGTITTDKGQTLLAAGDSFILRRGVATDANQFSTTRGSEVAPQFVAGSTTGAVSNSGIIVAREGDITLSGRTVRQDGVALATTSVASFRQ